MKKIEPLIGIIPAPNMQKSFSKKNSPTEHWKALVKIWFDTYAELLPKDKDGDLAKPCFDTIESFQMKIIVRELKKRAEDKNIEWNEKNACERFKCFLLKAWDDDFISKNFMLRIISNNKTKIFNNQITPKKNGNNYQRSVGEKPIPTANPKRSVGKL